MKRSFILLLVIILLLEQGCQKKDLKLNFNESPNKLAILSAKQYILEQHNLADYTQKKQLDSILNSIIWSQANGVQLSSTKTVLFFPLSNSNLQALFLYDNQRKEIDSANLILIQSKRLRIIEGSAIAIKAYGENILSKNKIPTTEFSGNIGFYSLNSTFKIDFGFVNGLHKWTGFLSPTSGSLQSQKIKSASTNKNNLGPNGCPLWGHFTRWTDGSVTLEYTYEVCDIGCQTTAIGVKSGIQYIKKDCGGMGSGNGETGLMVLYNIYNQIIDTCISKFINKISEFKLSDTLSTMLKSSFLNSGTSQNLLFKSMMPDATNGPAYSYPTSNTWVVEINSSSFANTSKAYLLSVIAHEVVHYYVNEYFNQTGQTYIDNWGHHEYMFKNWVRGISNFLKSSDSTLSTDDAIALALGGMEDVLLTTLHPDPTALTNYWNNFSQTNYNMSLSNAHMLRELHNPQLSSVTPKGGKVCQ